MTAAEAPKPQRRLKKTAQGNRGVASSARSSTAFYKTQAEALEAARLQGAGELVVTFRPNVPGARYLRAKVTTEEFARLCGFGKLRKSKAAARTSELVPSSKLARSIKQAGELTTFFETKKELFDALERRD